MCNCEKLDVEVRRTPAVEWLECVRYHAGRIEELAREIAALEDAKREVLPWSSGGSGGGARSTHSDPTAAQAQSRIEGLDVLLAEKRAMWDESVHIVGECGEVIERMRSEVSERCADVIELYYIDRAPTWSDVAHEMGVTYRWVTKLRLMAYAWIDAHR